MFSFRFCYALSMHMIVARIIIFFAFISICYTKAGIVTHDAEWYDQLLYSQVDMLNSVKLQRLYNIKSGILTKKNIEIVIARYKESIVWSDFYKSIVTIYDKSKMSSDGMNIYPEDYNMNNVIFLPNVGRESHTYLYHIVKNYDNLADVTVFTQGTVPNSGYSGPRKNHNSLQGHLKVNSTFHDFVLGPNGHFSFTSALWLPTLAHCVFGQNSRSIERDEAEGMCPLIPISKKCDVKFSFDFAGYGVGKGLLYWITKGCLKQRQLGCSGPMIWDKYIKLPYPPEGVVYFDQGGIFSVTREQIRRRPKADYEALLVESIADIDPYIGYFLEWFWYYLLTSDTTPCNITADDFSWAKSLGNHEFLEFRQRLRSLINIRRVELLNMNLTHLLPENLKPKDGEELAKTVLDASKRKKFIRGE